MKRLLFHSTPLAGLLVALAAFAPAAGATHVLDLGDRATLVAKGAGVLVPIEVSCDSSSPAPLPGGSLVVSVTQRHGNRVAEGFGAAAPMCDGTAHVTEVLVPAGDSPFRNGSALATASMFVCDFSAGCHEARDSQVIEISKGTR